MATSIYFYFQGTIENGLAICNTCELCMYSSAPHYTVFPAIYCDVISKDELRIEKKLFNKLKKKGEIKYYDNI